MRETSRSWFEWKASPYKLHQLTRTKEGQTNAAGAALAVPSGGTTSNHLLGSSTRIGRSPTF